jgi:hypothetical protein
MRKINYFGSLSDYKQSIGDNLRPGEPDPRGMSTSAYDAAMNKWNQEQKSDKESVKIVQDMGMRPYSVGSEYTPGMLLGFGKVVTAIAAKEQSPRRVQQAIKPEMINVVKKIRPLSKDTVKVIKRK